MRFFDPQQRQVLLSTLSGSAGYFFAAIGPLLTTPIILPYIGEFRYGIWMMLLSINALFGLSDLGISNGVTTPLAQAGNDTSLRRRLISNVYALLSLISLVLLVIAGTVVVLLSRMSDWWPVGVEPALVMS